MIPIVFIKRHCILATLLLSSRLLHFRHLLHQKIGFRVLSHHCRFHQHSVRVRRGHFDIMSFLHFFLVCVFSFCRIACHMIASWEGGIVMMSIFRPKLDLLFSGLGNSSFFLIFFLPD